MKKTEINKTEMNEAAVNNPFNFEATDTGQSTSRKIDMTPQLISISNQRAIELIKAVGQNSSLHELANRTLDDGNASDTIELINTVFDEDNLKADAEFLNGTDNDILARLLESRRSDRSKTKSKGLRKNIQIAQTFYSAMYAELLVRLAMNKPYQEARTEIDDDELASDQESLNKKIRSLQSKQSRLRKTAKYEQADAKQLEEVVAEIDRLSQLRTNGKVSTKTGIKNAEVDTIREALKLINVEGLEADEQAKILELMKKLG